MDDTMYMDLYVTGNGVNWYFASRLNVIVLIFAAMFTLEGVGSIGIRLMLAFQGLVFDSSIKIYLIYRGRRVKPPPGLI